MIVFWQFIKSFTTAVLWTFPKWFFSGIWYVLFKEGLIWLLLVIAILVGGVWYGIDCSNKQDDQQTQENTELIEQIHRSIEEICGTEKLEYFKLLKPAPDPDDEEYELNGTDQDWRQEAERVAADCANIEVNGNQEDGD